MKWMIKLLYASLLFEKPLWSIGFVKLDQNRKVDRRIIGNYRNSETLMPGISYIDAWHVLFGWRQCNPQSVFICLHVWRMLGVAQGIREAMAVECCVHIRHSFLSPGNLLVTVTVRDVGMSRAVDLSKENYIKCYAYSSFRFIFDYLTYFLQSFSFIRKCYEQEIRCGPEPDLMPALENEGPQQEGLSCLQPVANLGREN